MKTLPIRPWLLIAALFVGIALRLIWPHDMEYFNDQHGIFQRVMDPLWNPQKDWIHNGLGIGSSVGIESPGLTYWIFQIPAKILSITTPPQLALFVRVVNIFALLAFLFFAIKIVSEKERETWLWAWLLMLVNPFSVLFQRRIWPPSLLYLLMALFLISWWRSDRRWGNFLFGVTGALMAQIHMLGALLVGSFFLWGWMNKRRPLWIPLIAGVTIGILPAIPWLIYFWGQMTHGGHTGSHVVEVAYQMRFWRYWLTQPFGLLLTYTLEPGGYFREYLATPIVFGHATYIVGIVHALIGALMALIIGSSLKSFFAVFNSAFKKKSFSPIVESFLGKNLTDAAIHSGLWGYGITMTAKTFYIYRHYLIISTPLDLAWLARSALALKKWGRPALGALWVLQLVLSATLLLYLHNNGGAPGAEYGDSYRRQVEMGVWTTDNNLKFHRDTFQPKPQPNHNPIYRPESELIP